MKKEKCLWIIFTLDDELWDTRRIEISVATMIHANKRVTNSACRVSVPLSPYTTTVCDQTHWVLYVFLSPKQSIKPKLIWLHNFPFNTNHLNYEIQFWDFIYVWYMVYWKLFIGIMTQTKIRSKWYKYQNRKHDRYIWWEIEEIKGNRKIHEKTINLMRWRNVDINTIRRRVYYKSVSRCLVHWDSITVWHQEHFQLMEYYCSGNSGIPSKHYHIHFWRDFFLWSKFHRFSSQIHQNFFENTFWQYHIGKPWVL